MKTHTFRDIENKKAHYEYTIVDTMEAGMKLTGDVVKLIHNNSFNLTGNYVRVMSQRWRQVVMIGESSATIPLLLHQHQINTLIGTVQQDGMTLIPLKIYLKRGKFKLLIGVAKGKKDYDKRATDKKRDIDNDIRRTVSSQKFGEY